MGGAEQPTDPCAMVQRCTVGEGEAGGKSGAWAHFLLTS